MSLPLTDLRHIVARFPYFQTAHILLLKKMKLDNHAGFDLELKNSAVHIGDRAKLYIYLHPLGNEPHMNETLPELTLITTEGEEDNSVTASYYGEEGTRFNYLFLSDEEALEVNQEEVLKSISAAAPDIVKSSKKKEWALIDRFMNLEARKIVTENADLVPQGNLAQKSERENDTILTETLADIFIKQHKYEKAMNIFSNLSLKFPEKSRYFADRIKTLEILIKSDQ